MPTLRLFSSSFVALAISLLFPLASQATDDSRITSITVVEQSDSTASATATYDLELVTSATISSGETLSLMVQGYNEDTSTDSPLDSGFDFSGVTMNSHTITGTGVAPSTFYYQITLTANLPAGTHDLALEGLINSGVEGNYVFGATTGVFAEGTASTISADFIIGTLTTELVESNLTATAFGTNIGTTWPALDGAAGFIVLVSLNEDLSDSTNVDVGADLSYIFSGLTPNTTYYVAITGYDSEGGSVIVPYPSVTATTGGLIADTRFSKPTVPNKTIKTHQAKVKWSEAEAIDYVASYSLNLKRGHKTIKTYQTISATKLAKTLKRLKSDKNYTVQVRANYVTGESTKWSKTVKFHTDAASE